MNVSRFAGAGLGLRRELADALLAMPENAPDFLELAPENWIGFGGRHGRLLAALADRYPLVAHGLSLNLGGQSPLDRDFLRAVRAFLARYNVPLYSEHLSFCEAQGQFHDLLPLPFTGECVRHVATRIRQVQEFLGRRIAVENVSAYLRTPQDEMSEAEFVSAVLQEADCLLHLDVNNVYVNARNHGFDAREYLARLPSARIAHVHVAGHWRKSPTLIIDTHGEPVADPVWQLLGEAYALHGVVPTLLERDSNIPPLADLLAEVCVIRHHQSRTGAWRHAS